MLLERFLRWQRDFLFHILIDILGFSLAVYLSFLLRFDLSISPKYSDMIFSILLREIPLFLFFYFLFKIQESLWEYFSLKALKDLTLTITLEKFSFFLTHIIFPIGGLPRSILPLSYVTTLIILFSFRAITRWLYEKG